MERRLQAEEPKREQQDIKAMIQEKKQVQDHSTEELSLLHCDFRNNKWELLK